METKTKCLRCGYGLFFNKRKALEVACPKCLQNWKIVEDNEEIFLEPLDQLTKETVPTP